MGKKNPLISVIIPVFNEESTVGNVVRRVEVAMQKLASNYEIIAIDDYSTDRSRDVLKHQNVTVYPLKKHRGKGYALRSGFARANGEILVTIDSDGSHRPEELSRILMPVLEDQADLVIGSRYLSQKVAATRKLNATGVRIFNSLIKLLTGVETSDSQSGYRAMKFEVLKDMRLESGEYEIESEMLVKAARKNFRIEEVPISFEQRTYGTSQLDPMIDGFKILLSIILASLRVG